MNKIYHALFNRCNATTPDVLRTGSTCVPSWLTGCTSGIYTHDHQYSGYKLLLQKTHNATFDTRLCSSLLHHTDKTVKGNDHSADSSAVNTCANDEGAVAPKRNRYTLNQWQTAGLSTYIAYLHDARHGMPSVFDLGVTRQQGLPARMDLLKRERILRGVPLEQSSDDTLKVHSVPLRQALA